MSQQSARVIVERNVQGDVIVNTVIGPLGMTRDEVIALLQEGIDTARKSGYVTTVAGTWTESNQAAVTIEERT